MLFYVGVKPSLTLRVEHMHVLKGISGSNTEEIVEEWRKLHNGELHDRFSSPDAIRYQNKRMRWVEHATRVGQKTNAYRGLVCETENRR
jgi:hypothetical protein